MKSKGKLLLMKANRGDKGIIFVFTSVIAFYPNSLCFWKSKYSIHGFVDMQSFTIVTNYNLQNFNHLQSISKLLLICLLQINNFNRQWGARSLLCFVLQYKLSMTPSKIYILILRTSAVPGTGLNWVVVVVSRDSARFELWFEEKYKNE